jgi:hypothetical protein
MNLWGLIGNVRAAILRKWWIGVEIPLPSWYTKPMSNFHYFTDEEIAGLIAPLPAMLDMARGIAGIPFRLTATVAKDGHSPKSSHYKGLAVDIGLGHLAEGADRGAARWAIMKGLYGAGFKRIEDCPLHIHCDIGEPPDYVSPYAWIGQDV